MYLTENTPFCFRRYKRVPGLGEETGVVMIPHWRERASPETSEPEDSMSSSKTSKDTEQEQGGGRTEGSLTQCEQSPGQLLPWRQSRPPARPPSCSTASCNSTSADNSTSAGSSPSRSHTSRSHTSGGSSRPRGRCSSPRSSRSSRDSSWSSSPPGSTGRWCSCRSRRRSRHRSRHRSHRSRHRSHRNFRSHSTPWCR
ncbi:serine/arginine repetitive matrix protein 4-like isoform X2 [Panthera tigris]|uniref:serine/arginine repetitive matrix protein 4-like isoform X2 n=1 Tax=Panthera tigris TaxID=9694 RepID=UPI001C6FB544|nr:serine/arginine repetitive matrix protein 4-like isoform X2 [Panthera tigris]